METIWILAQEKILIRILCNLIDNALKYSTGDIMFYMWGESEYCHIQISNPSDYISDEELNLYLICFTQKMKQGQKAVVSDCMLLES